VNTGTMGVNSLPKTVTRQRRGCDLNPGLSAPESSTRPPLGYRASHDARYCPKVRRPVGMQMLQRFRLQGVCPSPLTPDQRLCRWGSARRPQL